MSIKSITFSEPLDLETGGVIKRPTVAYSTYGSLNSNKSNVTLVCHALTANSEVNDWWRGLFGENKVFDINRDFIICINNLGSPYGSSSPKSINTKGDRYGMSFPDYTLRDTAELHLRLLQHLGIDTINLVIGGSCGGNIAQEIAILRGELVHSMILLCCSASETPWVISIHESQRIALDSDATLLDNTPKAGQKGLRGARAFALPFYRSHPSFKLRQTEEDINKLNDFKASSYVRYQGDKFVQRYDAHCYYKQLLALDTHNVARNRGSISTGLQKISAKTLVIGFDTDLLIPIVEQKTLAENIPNGRFAKISTLFGHDAFLIETDLIQDAIDDWRSKIT